MENPTTAVSDRKKPVVCLLIGMAGSGKTTFLQRLNAHIHTEKIPSYIINLDPAVGQLPFGVNIDIRDTVNYKQVMKQYGLGPNGGILTSLNLFSTRLDQVLDLIEKKADHLDYVFVDTPGQIEIFTWSASGAIITESLASSFPTVICFIVDTPNCINPTTFMSNMLYACSILYKTKLPIVILFNKIDIADHAFAVEWMENFDAFEAALNPDQSYMSTLTRSLSLVLDEFYKNLRSVGVSAVTGNGIFEYFKAINAAALEFDQFYRADLKKRYTQKEAKAAEERKQSLLRLKRDLEKSKGRTVVLDAKKANKEITKTDDDAMNEEEEEEEEEIDEKDEEERKDYDELMEFIQKTSISK